MGNKYFLTFIDFRRAFDSVEHDRLFEKLKLLRVSDRAMAVLKALYSVWFVSLNQGEKV
jgi:hypothetical protein